MKYIAVFCSANDIAEKYTGPARELSALIASHGYNLVWGGSDKGLMNIVATTVQKGGGKLFGVSMEFFKDVARKNADEMVIAKDLGERKSIMLAKCEAIVVLIGGLGTFDEVAQILELKNLGIHEKPIVILNTENFYEGLKVQLQKMKDDGFVDNPLDELVYFADKPEEAILYIDGRLKK
jgi:uncharacterized protein (TIGR00730 family)